jgi:DNA polymerase-3 subunit alpha
VRLHYSTAQALAPLDFGDHWRVRLDDALFDGLRDWLPASAVGVTYA